MLDLIKNNPFRTLGVYANATSSAIAGRSMQLQAKLRSGLSTETPESLDTLCGNVERTFENISIARSALQRPSDRLEHALFWFTSADAIDTAAFDAIRKGNTRLAEDIWKGSPESVSAQHNLALLMLITDRAADALTIADKLFSDNTREICFLLAPGISMSSQELSTLYKKLAPVTTIARAAVSEVIEPEPPRPKPKPRPAVSIKTTPEVKPVTIAPFNERPTPSESPIDRTRPKAECPVNPPQIIKPVAEAEPDSNTGIRNTLEYLNTCIKRLTEEKPSIQECTRFFNDTDSGMSRLRNDLESKDPAAYRSWSDGCAHHLMAALSRLGKYHKGEPKTAQAMTLLTKCKSWGLSLNVEKEVNDYIARLYAAKSNDSTTVLVICAVVFIIFLIRACSY